MCFILSENFSDKRQQIAPYMEMSNTHVGILAALFVLSSFNQTQDLPKLQENFTIIIIQGNPFISF
jgi:hypothetical protein